MRRLASTDKSRWAWRLLVLEAALWLALARLCLRWVPFRRLALWLGPGSAAGDPTAGSRPASEADALAAHRIGAAIRRAARLGPGDVLCLPQAMAAKAMLARRGIKASLHLGAAPMAGPTALAAHAWLMVGDDIVTGGAARPGFAELIRFG